MAENEERDKSLPKMYATAEFLWYKPGDIINDEDNKQHGEKWFMEGLVSLEEPKDAEQQKKEDIEAKNKALQEAKAKTDADVPLEEESPAEGKNEASEEEPNPEDSRKAEQAWFDRLVSINGIGNATARDICQVFASEADLRAAIEAKEELPFRKDYNELLLGEFC